MLMASDERGLLIECLTCTGSDVIEEIGNIENTTIKDSGGDA